MSIDNAVPLKIFSTKHEHALVLEKKTVVFKCDYCRYVFCFFLSTLQNSVYSYSQTPRKLCYRCTLCNYNLCPECMERTAVRKAVVDCHPHPLLFVDKDNGWFCNGKSFPGGCKRGIKG